MSKSNANRRRISVELGQDVEAMLLKLRLECDLKQTIGYFGEVSESFLIRWAICCYFKSRFPKHPLANLSPYHVGSQAANGPRRRRT